MAITSFSSKQPPNRRQQLKSDRRLKFWQRIWRIFLLSIMISGLFWFITSSNWLIFVDSQIEIKGNQLLSQEKIHSLIKLNYPQSLWQIPTQRLVQDLESSPPVKKAVISRLILPATIRIQIEERQPVAVALLSSYTLGKQEGFLDSEGIFIPRIFYTKFPQNYKYPTFKVIGYQDYYQKDWPNIYHLISQSTVKIFILDLQNPKNFILQTQLGKVYLGDSFKHLDQQLLVLNTMRNLSQRIPREKILYIDLTNPDAASIIDINNEKSDLKKLQ